MIKYVSLIYPSTKAQIFYQYFNSYKCENACGSLLINIKVIS